jgi:catechol 2,3-dioxygenase-like lactoylglutathione lyase family enzyme
VTVATTLRLELFVGDMRASLDFYARVLGFETEAERPGGYTPLAKRAFRLLDPDGYYWRVTSRE